MGELGPADLTTLVLQAENAPFNSSLDDLICQMAMTLTNRLFDSHIQVSQAASYALYAFVSTRTGFKAAGNLSLVFGLVVMVLGW